MHKPIQINQTKEPLEVELDALNRKCKRLKLWQWFGLALVSVPFACLVIYELIFERVGSWSYWLILLACIGFTISFVAKRIERRLWVEYFSDTGAEGRD